jgi:hypothetical protein
MLALLCMAAIGPIVAENSKEDVVQLQREDPDEEIDPEELADELASDENDEAAELEAADAASESQEKQEKALDNATKKLEENAKKAAEILKQEMEGRQHKTLAGKKDKKSSHTTLQDNRAPCITAKSHHEGTFAGCRCKCKRDDVEKVLSICSEGAGIDDQTERCSKTSNADCNDSDNKKAKYCACKPPSKVKVSTPFKNSDLPTLKATSLTQKVEIKNFTFLTYAECHAACHHIGCSILADRDKGTGTGCGFNQRQVWINNQDD